MGTRQKQTFPKEDTQMSNRQWKMLNITNHQFSSVHFSRSVMSNSLRQHESQHARPPCPSPSPGVHSNSHPSSQRCHPAISSSVILFSSCPQSFLVSRSFQMSQLRALDMLIDHQAYCMLSHFSGI